MTTEEIKLELEEGSQANVFTSLLTEEDVETWPQNAKTHFTNLNKALADSGIPQTLVLIDMTNYKNKTAVNKAIGAVYDREITAIKAAEEKREIEAQRRIKLAVMAEIKANNERVAQLMFDGEIDEAQELIQGKGVELAGKLAKIGKKKRGGNGSRSNGLPTFEGASYVVRSFKGCKVCVWRSGDEGFWDYAFTADDNWGRPSRLDGSNLAKSWTALNALIGQLPDVNTQNMGTQGLFVPTEKPDCVK